MCCSPIATSSRACASLRWMNAPETPNAGVLCVIPFFHVFGMTIGLHLTVAKAIG